MSGPTKSFHGTRVLAAFALVAPFALSACLESTGIAAKAGYSLSSSQANCLLPNTSSVRNITQRLAANSITLNFDFCSKPGGYDCVVHKFGPSLANSESVVGESVNVPELGGDVSISVNSQSFNTFSVAHLPGVSASASQPGGELNHTEYVCNQHDLRDAETSLAIGEADNLKDALASAYAQCSSVAPRVVSGN